MLYHYYYYFWCSKFFRKLLWSYLNPRAPKRIARAKSTINYSHTHTHSLDYYGRCCWCSCSLLSVDSQLNDEIWSLRYMYEYSFCLVGLQSQLCDIYSLTVTSYKAPISSCPDNLAPIREQITALSHITFTFGELVDTIIFY